MEEETVIPKGTKYVIEIEMAVDITEVQHRKITASIYGLERPDRPMMEGMFYINSLYVADGIRDYNHKIVAPILAAIKTITGE